MLEINVIQLLVVFFADVDQMLQEVPEAVLGFERSRQYSQHNFLHLRFATHPKPVLHGSRVVHLLEKFSDSLGSTRGLMTMETECKKSEDVIERFNVIRHAVAFAGILEKCS